MNGSKGDTVTWAPVVLGQWELTLAATDAGLCWIGSGSMQREELDGWINRRLPHARTVRDDDKCKPYSDQLIAYLQGRRTAFSVPTDRRGTPFQLQVWEALGRIAYGETRTYADIAHEIGKPSAARAVGAAIGANPLLIAVPCHRVIGKTGTLTGYRGGLAMKEELLALERLHGRMAAID